MKTLDEYLADGYVYIYEHRLNAFDQDAIIRKIYRKTSIVHEPNLITLDPEAFAAMEILSPVIMEQEIYYENGNITVQPRKMKKGQRVEVKNLEYWAGVSSPIPVQSRWINI